MYKIFIDVETTGLSEWKYSIIQLAGIIGWEEAGALTAVEEFNYWLTIREGELPEQVALDIIGKDIVELKECGLNRKEVFEEFKEKLDGYVDKYNKIEKFLFYGYNSPFDNKFLRAFWKEHGDKFFGSYFWTPDIDVMRLAADHIGDDREGMKDFKQNSVATKLGIEFKEEELHDAMQDVYLTRDIYYKLKEVK